MECRVEYDYAAQEEDELSLKKGDIILNVTQKMDGWWEGTLKGKTGMFPDNFVKVMEKSKASTAPPEPEPIIKTEPGSNGVTLRSNPSKSARRLKALFSYAPEQEDELKLDIGDIIDFVAEVEEGWWRGKLKGRVGIFPSNFVSDYESISNGKTEPEQTQNDMNKVNNSKGVPDRPDVPPAVPATAPPLEDEPAPELPPKPVRELARCFYPYQGQNEDELTLIEGDIVTIISKNCEDEGWWRGELKGKNGLFPDNFVKLIPSNESSNQNKTFFPSATSNATKISPQAGGRNLKGVQPLAPGGGIDTNVTEKTIGSSVVDGGGNSKMQDKEKPVMSKVGSAKALFSKPFSSAPKPTTPTSPVTPGIPGGFGKPEIRKNASFGKEDRKSDEEDFNSIERGEKLNHLTAQRAKAPKRRPPSTLIPRENDVSMTNGSLHSQESIDSPPPVNHSTPFNSTLNSSTSAYGTPSGSILDTSAVSAGGSFLSQSKDSDSSANSPANGNTSAGAAKPKKLLPWMAELKQTQDKKRGLTSPVSSIPPNASNTNNVTTSPSVPSPTSLPLVSSSTPPALAVKEKEAAPLPVAIKAPPLPAKPSSLATSISIDKPSSVSPSTTAAPSVANRVFGKKPPPVSPMHGMPNNFVNSIGGHDSNAGGGDSKQFVPYEEYAKLRDRVMILETELETVRRQVKILLDRELNHGHIV